MTRLSRSTASFHLILGLVILAPSDAFLDGIGSIARLRSIKGRYASRHHSTATVRLLATSNISGFDSEGSDIERKRPSLLRRVAAKPVAKLGKALKPAALGLFAAASLNLNNGALPTATLRPPAAVARLPIDAVQDTNLDMKKIAMDRKLKERDARRAAESIDHQAECDRIEKTHGTKARKQYEADYRLKQEQLKEERAAKRESLLNGLLSRGICPFTDTEGVRQLFLFDEDIDLAQVEGTEQYYDFVETMAGKEKRVQKKYTLPRFIIKCQVEDLRAHGKDAVPYFQENVVKTAKLFEMTEKKLQMIADQYKARIAEYGTLNPVTEEEAKALSAAVAVAGSSNAGGKEAASEVTSSAYTKRSAMSLAREQKRAAKEASRAEKANARASARVAKEEARAARRAEKVKIREDKLDAIKERKESKAATKAATAAAAAVASHAAADLEMAATAGMDMMATAGLEAVSPSHMDSSTTSAESAMIEAASSDSNNFIAKKRPAIVPATTALVGIVGGGYVYKIQRERSASEEEERQRQFKLIMGLAEEDADDDVDQDDDDDDDGGDFVGSLGSDFPSMMDNGKKSTKNPEANGSDPPPPTASAAKKRFGGIKSVFTKKPGRETDLNKLVAPDSKAPEFCATLAKGLTFGAPGRFPTVEGLPAGKALEEFDLEKARELLREEADKIGLSDQDACEEFAKVVNCMIIDIIDLASSSLKEKDDKITVDAMNIVMDFMDHSAGLFEPFLTEGVSIKPVTYEGNLGRGKLEQLYTIYASSGMMSPGVSEDRIDMFRELFEIKEKKAEGLVQKKMMKNLFKMMKDPEAMQEMMGGEGMEGMAEMMEAMGGIEDLAGMPGMDGEISPEQIKESVNMMKELVESGNVSKEEMKLVKEQFKTAYGMDMEELIANAGSDDIREQLGEEGEELLEMFKVILKATED